MAWAYFTRYHIPDTPQGYVIYGEFDSKESFEKHLNSAVVKSIGDELIPLLDAPPSSNITQYIRGITSGLGFSGHPTRRGVWLVTYSV